MSSTPRTWQRPRRGTPAGRARLRQPFRSPLLGTQAAGAQTTAGTPTSAGLRAAARQFRSPLLASRQDGTQTSPSEQDGTPPPTDLRTDHPPPGSAAPPLLRAAAAVSPPADSNIGSVRPSEAAESAAVSPSVEPGGGAPQPAASAPPQPADCELQAALSAADAELARLEAAGCRAEQLPLFIAALHGYNEVKDAAQMVMGRIAELDGVTVRTVHQRYDELPPAERC